jgi:predicted nucleic acid-binding protein
MVPEVEGVPADASSLIYVAKCDSFREVQVCVPLILVSPSVWEEAVDAGERIGAPEVALIKAAAETGWLQRATLETGTARLARSLAAGERLGRGESEVLALGRLVGRCIIDEGRAARVAASMGIASVPTLLLPALGYRSDRLGRSEAIELMRCLAVVTGATAAVVFAAEELLGGRG